MILNLMVKNYEGGMEVVNMVYGGICGFLMVVVFYLGYRMGYKQGKEIGTKVGVDSCADTAGWLINNYCCEKCIEEMRKKVFNRVGQV